MLAVAGDVIVYLADVPILSQTDGGTEDVPDGIQPVPTRQAVPVREISTIQEILDYRAHPYMRRIHRLNRGGIQCIVSRSNVICLTAQARNRSSGALRGRRTRVLHDPVAQCVRGHYRILHLRFCPTRAFVIEKEEQSVFLDRTTDRAAKNVTD